jgi:hypothetical protein
MEPDSATGPSNHHGKRALHAGVPASTSRHGNQAVGALFNRLVREHVVDHVVQHHAAPAVHRLVHVFARTQAGDDDRHLVLGAQAHVVLQPVVALVHDLVDGEGRGLVVRVRSIVRGQGFGDLGQPVFQLRGRTRVERGHGAHHASLALGNDELGVADDEQRRADHRELDVLQHRGQVALAGRHGVSVVDQKAGWILGQPDRAPCRRSNKARVGQKASTAMAVTASAPSTMLSRTPGARLRMWSA